MEKKKKEINLKSWVIQRLRGQSYKWPERQKALIAARVDRGLYKCAHCEGVFGRKEVQVDHIKPVVPLTGWDSFDGFITRLFCKAEEFQILCSIPCHSTKTTTEDTIRAKNNEARKAEEKRLLKEQKKLDKAKKT